MSSDLHRDSTIILLAGGLGKRFSGSTPKLLAKIKGEPSISLICRTILELDFLNQLVVAVNRSIFGEVNDVIETLAEAKGISMDSIVICMGGETRADSVKNALEHVTSPFILIHDAVRPLASAELFHRVRSNIRQGCGVLPILKPVDSVAVVNAEDSISQYLKRDEICLVQTPQGFVADEYRRARRLLGARAKDFTDDGSIFLYAGYRLIAVAGEPVNIKITYPQDIKLAEALLASTNLAVLSGNNQVEKNPQ